MDAPLYPPSSHFEQPSRIARRLTTRDTAIADLKAVPAAWAIVVKELPNIEQRIASDLIKPHLGNFSFRLLVQFGLVKADALDRIDQQFAALGAVR